MKATLNDIAKRTGLSVASVSRALHRADSRNVSSHTRERVLSVARDLGYQPNLLSRSLVTGRTQTISYWTYNAFAPYYATIARSICEQAVRRGYFVHIHNALDWYYPLDLAQPSSALALSFDGVISCDVSYQQAEQPAARPSNVPLVCMGINHPTDCDFVEVDLGYGAMLAMEHLLEMGCKRIAHMGHPDPLTRDESRAVVYDRYMRSAGLKTEWIAISEHTRECARTAIRSYVQEKGVPEAIFCVNDDVAVGCYRGLADVGIEVPDDVLLVGCDGLTDTEFQRCPITTIVTPIERMCELAWDFLEARIQDPTKQELQQITLKPELAIRESTIGRKPLSKKDAR